jgi:hypothetical protein
MDMPLGLTWSALAQNHRLDPNECSANANALNSVFGQPDAIGDRLKLKWQ